MIDILYQRKDWKPDSISRRVAIQVRASYSRRRPKLTLQMKNAISSDT